MFGWPKKEKEDTRILDLTTARAIVKMFENMTEELNTSVNDKNSEEFAKQIRKIHSFCYYIWNNYGK